MGLANLSRSFPAERRKKGDPLVGARAKRRGGRG